MKKLREITEIFSSKRLKRIELLAEDELYGQHSKLGELYQGIQHGEILSDEDAARYLYQTDAQDTKYRQLKFRYKKRLLNNLFFLDTKQPEFSEYHKTYYTCNKNWALIKILLSNGARDTAFEILKKTVTEAEKFKLTDILFLCSRELQNHYSLLGDMKNFEHYVQQTEQYEKILAAENEANKYFQHLVIQFAQTVEWKPELTEEAKSSYQKLKKLASQFDSFSIHYNMYNVWALSFEMESKYRKALEVYEKLEAYLLTNPNFYQKVRMGEIALKKMACYLYLRDHENGELNAAQCLHLFTPGSNYWFVFYEYYFLLAMHTEKWESAADIYQKATKHSRFRYLTPEKREKWKIYEAYLYYILKHEGIQLKYKTNKSDFKIYKFINEVPIYSKDKRGLNVAILIVQLLLHLESRDYDVIITLSDSLKTYANRYLKKQPHHARNLLFIKMLIAMEKESFGYERTLEATEPTLSEMVSSKDPNKSRVTDMEIIPFDILWSKVLETLKEIDDSDRD
jgi:hypothetical protein